MDETTAPTSAPSAPDAANPLAPPSPADVGRAEVPEGDISFDDIESKLFERPLDKDEENDFDRWDDPMHGSQRDEPAEPEPEGEEAPEAEAAPEGEQPEAAESPAQPPPKDDPIRELIAFQKAQAEQQLALIRQQQERAAAAERERAEAAERAKQTPEWHAEQMRKMGWNPEDQVHAAAYVSMLKNAELAQTVAKQQQFIEQWMERERTVAVETQLHQAFTSEFAPYREAVGALPEDQRAALVPSLEAVNAQAQALVRQGRPPAEAAKMSLALVAPFLNLLRAQAPKPAQSPAPESPKPAPRRAPEVPTARNALRAGATSGRGGGKPQPKSLAELEKNSQWFR